MTNFRVVVAMLVIAGCGKSGANSPEARLKLRELERRVKSYYVEKAEFPVGQVALTPAKACCPDRCAPSATAFSDLVWTALDFRVDEPHWYQYSYASDGKTGFTATAVGDPGCNGSAVTYTLVGKVENGNITASVTGPS